MKISCFNNIKNIKYPISIAVENPDDYKGPKFLDFVPKYICRKEMANKDFYIKEYTEQLSILKPENILIELSTIYNVPLDDVALLCNKKSNELYYIHLVTNWLNDIYVKSHNDSFSRLSIELGFSGAYEL